MALKSKEERAKLLVRQHAATRLAAVRDPTLQLNKAGGYTRHSAAAKASVYNSDPVARKLRNKQVRVQATLSRTNTVLAARVEYLKTATDIGFPKLVAAYIKRHTTYCAHLAKSVDVTVYTLVEARKFAKYLAGLNQYANGARTSYLALHKALGTEALDTRFYEVPTYLPTL